MTIDTPTEVVATQAAPVSELAWSHGDPLPYGEPLPELLFWQTRAGIISKVVIMFVTLVLVGMGFAIWQDIHKTNDVVHAGLPELIDVAPLDMPTQDPVAPHSYDAGPQVNAIHPPPAQIPTPSQVPSPAVISSPDETFLAFINQMGYRVFDVTAAQNAGHQACDRLAVTNSLEDAELYVRDVLGIVEPNAHVVTLAAAVAYCPGIRI